MNALGGSFGSAAAGGIALSAITGASGSLAARSVADLAEGSWATVTDPTDGLYVPSGISLTAEEIAAGTLTYKYVLLVKSPLPAESLPDIVRPTVAGGNKYWQLASLSKTNGSTTDRIFAMNGLEARTLNGRAILPFSGAHPTV